MNVLKLSVQLAIFALTKLITTNVCVPRAGKVNIANIV